MRRTGFSGTSLLAGSLLAAGLLLAASAPAQTPPPHAPSAQPPSPGAPTAQPPSAPPGQAPSAQPPAPQAPSGQAPSAQPPAAQAPSGQAPSGQPLPPPAPPPAAGAGRTPSHSPAFEKGQQLLEAGRYVEAAHTLADALREAMADPATPREVPYYIAGELQKARAHIGILYVAADSGREISVDGVSVGHAPILGEILLAPGKHRVVARGEICLGKEDFELKPGEARRVKVGCSTAPRWRTPLLVTGLSAGVIGIGVGIGLFTAASGKATEIDAYVQESRRLGYVDPYSASLVAEKERSRVDLLNASITSFVIGGSLLAGTAAVFFGVKRRRPDEPPPLVGASIGAGQAGLWMRW